MSDYERPKLKRPNFSGYEAAYVEEMKALHKLSEKKMADEITRLKAQVAAAYDDAAEKLEDHDGVPCSPAHPDLWSDEGLIAYESGQMDAAISWQKAIRNRTPDDAAEALDTLLERAVKAALEEAAKRTRQLFEYPGPYNDGIHDAFDAIRAIDPATIVEKIKCSS